MNEKWVSRLEAKLDALLEKQGIKPADFDMAPTAAAAQPRKLTPAEQQAIDNAPKTPTGANGPQGNAPRTTATNAPNTSSSTPPVPPQALGSVTVETTLPRPEGSRQTDVQTMDADDAKRGVPRKA